MKKFFVVIAAMAVFYVLPVTALAEKLSVTTTEWSPYVIVENGKPTGIFIEIILEICKRLGIDPEFPILPWARCIKYMQDGTSDAILGPKKTDERLEFMYFPSEPLYMEKLVIIAKKESNIKADKLDDLNGKKIGVVRDYSYGSDFDKYQGINKIVCDHDEQLMKIFEAGRVETAVGDEGNLKFIAKKIGITVPLETVYVLTEAPNYIAFSKKAPGDKGKVLAEKFSDTLRQLREEGFIKKVESKYF